MINLLVIKSSNPELLKEQYEYLGFNFDYHQHGNGPFHYSAEKEGLVFEIYPLPKTLDKADNSIRLGFELENLELLLDELKKSDWQILSECTRTEFGTITVVEDREGRRIELKQK